ncbi:MAG: FixH family protein [Burkholderiaceae bacterium]
MEATMPDNAQPPWYRQFWPWMLIALPATAVVAGFITLWLAARTSDTLVVDDYYKEGKAINRQLERDAAARRLGLRATGLAAPDGLRFDLQAKPGAQAFEWPERLSVRLVHATLAPLDRGFDARQVGAGAYVAPGQSLPGEGQWTLHIEDPRGGWRLVGRLTGGVSTTTIEAGR